MTMSELSTWRVVLTRDELLDLRPIGAFVTVMNYRVGYSSEVTHVASSSATFHPVTHKDQHHDEV